MWQRKQRMIHLDLNLELLLQFQLFMKIAAKVMTTMAMIISGDEFDVHDNADFWNLSALMWNAKSAGCGDLVEILAKYIVMDNANCSKNDVDYKDDEYVEKMMTMTTKRMTIMWTMMMLMMI